MAPSVARLGVVQDVGDNLRLLELEMVRVAVLVERVDVRARHTHQVGQQLGCVLRALLLLHEHAWRPPRAHRPCQSHVHQDLFTQVGVPQALPAFRQGHAWAEQPSQSYHQPSHIGVCRAS